MDRNGSLKLVERALKYNNIKDKDFLDKIKLTTFLKKNIISIDNGKWTMENLKTSKH